MTQEPYLQRLTGELVDRMEKLPEVWLERHRRWLRANQNRDGGFSGREGPSDLYYTGFALRALAITQGLTQEIANRSAQYLQTRMVQSATLIDLFSFLVSSFFVQLGGGPDLLNQAQKDWPLRLGNLLEGFRSPDGGYAKEQQGKSGSTYHTFLALLLMQLCQQEVPQADRIVSFVLNRNREDGGFVEVDAMQRSGTNPTAAGVGTLQILGALTPEIKEKVIAFLMRSQSEFEGGFRANERIPSADLLSTFTSCWTLEQLGALRDLDESNIRSFCQAVESPHGGFRAGLWDQQIDVEYTFYGLGVIGLLAR